MKWVLAERAMRDYRSASSEVQRALDKQLRLLAQNLNHPSIHAEKYDETRGIWQGRVNRSWRFYFSIDGDTYIILAVIAHPK